MGLALPYSVTWLEFATISLDEFPSYQAVFFTSGIFHLDRLDYWRVYPSGGNGQPCMHVQIHMYIICMYIYIYIVISTYICIHVCVYIYIYIPLSKRNMMLDPSNEAGKTLAVDRIVILLAHSAAVLTFTAQKRSG